MEPVPPQDEEQPNHGLQWIRKLKRSMPPPVSSKPKRRMLDRNDGCGLVKDRTIKVWQPRHYRGGHNTGIDLGTSTNTNGTIETRQRRAHIRKRSPILSGYSRHNPRLHGVLGDTSDQSVQSHGRGARRMPNDWMRADSDNRKRWRSPVGNGRKKEKRRRLLSGHRATSTKYGLSRCT